MAPSSHTARAILAPNCYKKDERLQKLFAWISKNLSEFRTVAKQYLVDRQDT